MPPAERRQLLHLPVERGGQRRSSVEYALDVVADEVGDREQVPARSRGSASDQTCSRVLPLADEEHAVALVDLDELHLDALFAAGGQVLSDVVGADRQLAVAAVDEHGELHARRPPELEQRVDRGADRPARVQDVVDEDDRHPLDRERDARGAHDRLAPRRAPSVADVDVVTMERDVERADGELEAAPLLDEASKPRRERRTARLDADECDARRARPCAR